MSTADAKDAVRLAGPPRRAGLATVALMAVTIAWGTTYVMSKALVDVMPVSSFLFWRFAIATLALIVLAPRAVLRLSGRDLRRALLVGAALAAGFGLQSFGLQLTTATSSGFVTGMFVVLTPLVAGVLFGDRIPARAWLGIALAVVGLAALSLDGLSLSRGDALTLAGALGFAVQIAALARWSTSSTAVGMATVQMGTVATVSLVVSAFAGGVVTPPESSAWLSLAFLGVVASAVAFAVQSWSQAHMSATKGAVIIATETMWAAVAGVTIAHDPITARLVTGSVLLLGAMAVVQFPASGLLIGRRPVRRLAVP